MTRLGRWAGRSLTRWVAILGVLVYVVAVGSGLVASSQPALARPIGSIDDWILDSGFEHTYWDAPQWDRHPTADHDVVRAAPVEGDTLRRVRSNPFDAPDAVAVYYHLIAAHHPFLNAVDVDEFSGISLTCTTSSAVLEFPTAETNDRMAESVVSVPDGFCSGPSVIEAHTQYPVTLELSVPHDVDSGVVASRGLPSQLLRHLAIFTVFAVIGLAGAIALARVIPRLGGEASALLGFMLAIGLLSYAAFFVYWMSPTAGRVMSVLVVGSAVGFTLNELRRDRHRIAGVIRNLLPGLLMWFLVSAFAVTLLYSLDTGAGPWQANSRYFPAIWSSDNNLPMAVSEGLYRGEELPGILGGQWRVSDRGPLQAGAGALLRPLVMLIERAGVSGHRLAFFHHITGILLNTMWVLALVTLGIAMRWGRRLTQAAVVVVALSPVGVFNSTYVWPKMAAAAFALAAMSLVIDFADRSSPRPTRSPADWVTAAALSALALLCHASIAFFLFGVGLWILLRGPRPSWRPLFLAVATAAVIMVPWMSWQRLVDPPGNALVKYALAGTFGFDEPDKSVLDTVIDTYREIGFKGWWELRLDGLSDITVDYWTAPDFGGDQPDATRMTQQLAVAPALGPAILAVVAVTLIRGRQRDPAYRATRRLLLLGLVALAINVVVFWGPQILVSVPLATMMALTLGGVLALRLVNRWAAAVIALASVASYLVVWIADPLVGSHGVNVAAATLVAGAALKGTAFLVATLTSTTAAGAASEKTAASLP